MSSQPSVTIYTTPTCHTCRFAKKYMENKGINFKSVDVSLSPEGLTKIKSLGYDTAPVFVTKDGQHWQGLQTHLLDQLVVTAAA